MKDFINDCILFKSKDTEIKIIGVISWICVIAFIVMFINLFNF